MDLVLRHIDPLLLDHVYASILDSLQSRLCAQSQSSQFCQILGDADVWRRESVYRQSISIFSITWILSSTFFLFFSAICYERNFEKSLRNHPKYHKNQIRHEIADSLIALFVLNFLTVPIFVAQARGYAKLYDFGHGNVSLWYEYGQVLLFVLFSDTCIYWMHRAFHINVLFNLMHKKHHRYIIPTPFSAYAFDPLEAWIMSLPIYAYSFIWPMSREGQLFVFVATNIWTMLLHDNRDQFHTVHHKNIKLNFGQFMTLWDYLGGTYEDPARYFSARREAKLKT